MQWLDKIGDGLFKTDAVGNTAFYPWSFFGKGYVVPTGESKEQIRKLLRQANLISIIFVLVIIISGQHISHSTPFVVGILTAFTAWYWWNMKNLTQGMAPATEPMTYMDVCRTMAAKLHMAVSVVVALCALLFFWLALRLFFSAQGFLIGLLGVAVFGFLTAFYGTILYLKIKERQTPKA